SPPLAAAASTALHLVEAEPERIVRLQRNGKLFLSRDGTRLPPQRCRFAGAHPRGQSPSPQTRADRGRGVVLDGRGHRRPAEAGRAEREIQRVADGRRGACAGGPRWPRLRAWTPPPAKAMRSSR